MATVVLERGREKPPRTKVELIPHPSGTCILCKHRCYVNCTCNPGCCEIECCTYRYEREKGLARGSYRESLLEQVLGA